jgi:xanthine dehydrogenase iron-sulfur cluster and FAD-binding subunit A
MQRGFIVSNGLRNFFLSTTIGPNMASAAPIISTVPSLATLGLLAVYVVSEDTQL